MATLSEALTAYRICAQAEGKSPKTLRWIMSSVTYFSAFLGPERQDIDDITGNDLRQFIIALQQRPKFLKHPFNKPKQEKITAQSIETYARAIRAFFGYLHREEMIDHNPMQKVKMPRVPKKVVPTFSQKEVEILLSQPNKKTDRGFRDYAILLTFVDTAARLSEIVLLKEDDIDLENGYLRVMGKGGKERYIPFGHKVAKALHELYEEMVEAFYQKHVTETLSPENYFGPVVLEVKDVENDEADEINMRSKTGKNFSLVKDYTKTWLTDEEVAAEKFYFGYTHGQRIRRYLYPHSTKDLNATLANPRRFKEWKGEIDQFEHVVEILEEGPQARRAYVVIPHLIIDNPKSKFGIEEEKAPALIAIQFMIDEDHKLSGFALLRAQELSTFFVVNYLEVRSLIMELILRLTPKYPDIKAGKIVMLSAFGYFDPYTVLLDKPQICQLTETECQEYVSDLDKSEVRKKFIGLLKEFKKDYHKIDTEWCKKIVKYLNEAEYKQRDKVIEAIGELKRDLDKLEEERGGHSITGEIRSKKEETVDKFVGTIDRSFK